MYAAAHESKEEKKACWPSENQPRIFLLPKNLLTIHCLVGRNLSNSVSNFPYGTVTVSSECKARRIKLTVLTVGNTTCPKMMMVVFAHSVKVMELVQKEVIRKFSRGISTRRISIFRVGRKNVIKEDTTHRCLIEKVAAHVSLLLLLKCLCF